MGMAKTQMYEEMEQEEERQQTAKMMLRMMTLHIMHPEWNLRTLEVEANETFYQEEQDQHLAYLLSKDD